ncbi:hypothetical protein AB0D27_37210 [Streptomyces sp. NPDC048415]|uniref:hypothetical protein n=1 Tax=Streptomyces sp. NPDC048415 TaxID=3154822 RepID=UPI00342D544C
MLDARDAAPLPDWLEKLTTSRLPALASLAKAIREDQPNNRNRAGPGRSPMIRLQRTQFPTRWRG